MRNLFILLLIVFLLTMISVASCDRVGSSLNGSGKIIDQPIKITGFTKISARGSFPVEIVQSDLPSVTVSVDDNLIQRVIVALSGETLLVSIQAPGSFFPTSLKIGIRMPRIYGLILTDGAQASLSGFKSTYNFSLDMLGASSLKGYLDAGNVDFNIGGGSQVNLKGSALGLDLEAANKSRLDLSAFPANSATVHLSDGSEATLDIAGLLTTRLEGASTLYYFGSPTLSNTSITGGSFLQPR
jgi:hypothetical protein